MTVQMCMSGKLQHSSAMGMQAWAVQAPQVNTGQHRSTHDATCIVGMKQLQLADANPIVNKASANCQRRSGGRTRCLDKQHMRPGAAYADGGLLPSAQIGAGVNESG